MTAFSEGSIFASQRYSLELMTGQKALVWPEAGNSAAKAQTHQVTAYVHLNEFFATGLAARYSIFDPDTITDHYSDIRGSDLSVDVLLQSPSWKFSAYGAQAYIKTGLVVASEHVARTRTQNNDERFTLTGSNNDVSYNLRYKNQGYRIATGVRVLAFDWIDATTVGLVAEAAQGQEKWIQRRYYFAGEQYQLERTDDPQEYAEILFGFHTLQ